MSTFSKLRKVVEKTMVDKKIKDASKERMRRCQPFVKELLKVLYEKPTACGDDPVHIRNDNYNEIAVDIIVKMLQRDMYYDDVQFTFRLVKEVIEQAEHVLISNTEKNFNRASDKLWGGDIYDIKLSDIDRILKK